MYFTCHLVQKIQVKSQELVAEFLLIIELYNNNNDDDTDGYINIS